MPTVVREDKDHLTSALTITISQEDYLSKFEEELNQYRKKAHLKGFRKGKTSSGFLRKMYGRAILGEIVVDMMQKELERFVSEEKINILGQPIPAVDQPALDFDPKLMGDYSFQFDLGIAPEFEVQGADSTDTYTKLKVIVPEEEIDQELEKGRQALSKEVAVEGALQEGDRIRLGVVELEGEALRENGVIAEFSILYDRIADDALKAELSAKNLGGTLKLDPFTLEKDTSEAFVRKQLLQIDEEDEREIGRAFEATVLEKTRFQPAELDEEFFQEYFQGLASNVEEARELIRKDISTFHESKAGSLFFQEIQRALLEKNQLEFPEEFLKRWLLASDENLTEEKVETEFPSFLKGLQWSLIRGKLVDRFEVKVHPEEVEEYFKDRIRGYFGGNTSFLGDDFLQSMAARMMEDKSQLRDAFQNLELEKLVIALEEAVTLEYQPVSKEELEEKYQAAVKSVDPQALDLDYSDEEE